MCRHLMNWPDGIWPQLSPYLCSFSAWWQSGLLRRFSYIPCSGQFYFVTSVSLHMYFVMRVCWFVCSSLVAYFWYDVIETRLSNSKLHYAFLVPYFFGFYLSLGIPQFLFKVILLQLFCLLIPIWSSFVFVVIVIGFCLSEWYNRLCESWAGVRWHN